jgi:hypothetical protein
VTDGYQPAERATNTIVAVSGGHAVAMSLDGLKSNIRHAAARGVLYQPDDLYVIVPSSGRPNSLYSVRLLRMGRSIFKGPGYLYALVLRTGDHVQEFVLDVPDA